MNDLLVQSRFRNNILWTAMNGRTAAEICRVAGLAHPTTFGGYLNLKISPLRKDGTYAAEAHRIATYFKTLPEDLFPKSLYALSLPTVVNREYASESVGLMLAKGLPSLLPSPQQLVEHAQLSEAVDGALLKLTPREDFVIKLRFGLNGNHEHTLDEISQSIGVNSERIRQIEAKALRKLRNPVISRNLRPFNANIN
jgi:RNA polymerase sigma factor (sigma-70 family)